MYIPASFRENRLEVLHELMRAHNFATLFSQAEGEPFATHLPFMLDPARGPFGTLIAHFARANPHWKALREDTTVLVVFQGPHDYISPSYYTSPAAVPTWNYAVVHATGKPRLIHDEAALRSMVERLADEHESGFEYPWDMTHAAPLMPKMLPAIVGLELPIDRLEGKYKFNQNRSREDRQGVADALAASPRADSRAVAAVMRQQLDES